MTDCYDISLAVLKQSESDLQEALSISPHDINATNKFGQTALHLSIDWPLGMRILLKAGADTECVDQAGLVPLQYAVHRLLVDPIRILGQANCSFRDQRWVSASEMTHGEMGKRSVIDHCRMDHQWNFLEMLGMKFWSSIYEECEGLERSLMSVFDTLLELIVSRRKRLCDLARQTIPLSDIARWLPHSSDESHVIDETASSLAFELEYRGIHVPPHLHPGKDRITGYHYFAGYPKYAERLWNFGFRDVNGKDFLGRTPLMVRTLYFPRTGQGAFFILRRHCAQWLEYVTWVLSKCADLYARQDHAFIEGQCAIGLPQVRQLLSANAISLLAWKIGLVMAFQQQHRQCPLNRDNDPFPMWCEEWATESTQQTLRRILMDRTTDDCTCSCSASGCTARTLIIKSYASEMRRVDLYGQTNDDREIILRLVQLTDADAALWTSEALRWLTFQELRLEHTCCYWRYVDDHSDRLTLMIIKDQAKMNEILEENSAGLSLLEELLTEFEMKMDELDIPFPDFLTGYWEPRMEQVRDEWKGSSDMEALREFGLNW